MTIDEIKELIHVLQETGIAELEVQRGQDRVRIRRATSAAQDVIVPAVLPMTVSGAAQPAISPTFSQNERGLCPCEDDYIVSYLGGVWHQSHAMIFRDSQTPAREHI